jgi:hypothetical protein
VVSRSQDVPLKNLGYGLFKKAIFYRQLGFMISKHEASVITQLAGSIVKFVSTLTFRTN